MKLLRKIAVFFLTLVLASGAVFTELPLGGFTSAALAANSPVNAPVTPTTPTTPTVQVQAETTGEDTVAIKKITSTETTAVLPATVKANGKTYTVSHIESGAIDKKYKKVTLYISSSTKISAGIFTTKNAKKTKKTVIKAAPGEKLKASQFNKNAFKGYKGKIVIKKSAMTKKEFKKLVKKLRKGGFKGKIVRQ